MTDPLEQNMTTIWLEFLHEVTKTTALLMHLIAGIQTAYYKRRQVISGVEFTPPDVTGIDVFPLLMACNDRDLLGHECEAEQMAYKAWVLQIYNNIWESQSRCQFRKTSGDTHAIPWEIDALGDLRHIRNDLVHHNGIATEKQIGKCKILKWFKPTDKIVLGMRHVLDFLNHSGLLSRTTTLPGQTWYLKGDKRSLLDKASTAKIISVRIEIDKDPETGAPQFPMCVVFDNGVFCDGIHHPITFDEGPTSQNKTQFVKKVKIDENGNLIFPNCYLIYAEPLYTFCVCPDDAGSNDIRKTRMPGPAIKFRAPSPSQI